MKKKKTYYYKSYEDDFVETIDPNYKLPEDYVWIQNGFFYKIISKVLYKLFYIFGFIYSKFVLHIKIENKEILKPYKKTGYFIYGNHTLPMGDVFNPTRINKRKRIYVIGNSTNLKVKGIGPLLPYIGILPIPDSVNKMKELINAVSVRIKEKKAVIIYPEAHVWPYYTKIRPFKSSSFKFPVDNDAPSFCITTTYYKKKDKEKPGIKIFIDGPFLIDKKLSKKENQKILHDQIYNTMLERSKASTYEYIEYRRKE